MKTKFMHKPAPAFFALAFLFFTLAANAATLGRATAAFDNARPDRGETAWGRLVADSIRSAAGADIGLVHAAALQRGTLAAGEVTDASVNALLAFPGDDVVTITITGAQLRAALERAVQAYPTGSSAFLHGSGFSAQFNTQADMNQRLTLLRINGKEVRDDDSIRAAMPQPLAQGGSGYFTIWNAEKAKRAGVSVSGAIAKYIRAHGEIAPVATPRLAPQ
jgi:2',3'-cyclic-nucleotide 2'-phosphodiesterase (5'-nucleotidase family)